MSAKVHYEDNLFFLQSILRTVEAGLKLDIDPEFFHDKILEDIFFVHASITRTFSDLKESTHVINRTANLRAVRRSSAAYSQFLDRMLAAQSDFALRYQPYREKFAGTLDEHRELRQVVDGLLDQLDPEDEQAELVSSEEYDYLLAGDDHDTAGDLSDTRKE